MAEVSKMLSLSSYVITGFLLISVTTYTRGIVTIYKGKEALRELLEELNVIVKLVEKTNVQVPIKLPELGIDYILVFSDGRMEVKSKTLVKWENLHTSISWHNETVPLSISMENAVEATAGDTIMVYKSDEGVKIGRSH